MVVYCISIGPILIKGCGRSKSMRDGFLNFVVEERVSRLDNINGLLVPVQTVPFDQANRCGVKTGLFASSTGSAVDR